VGRGVRAAARPAHGRHVGGGVDGGVAGAWTTDGVQLGSCVGEKMEKIEKMKYI
jgi:hypothetical protein